MVRRRMTDAPIPSGRFHPEAMFRPRRVGLIGSGAQAELLAANLGGFAGLMRAGTVPLLQGAPPDVVVLAVPPEAVAAELAAAAQRGVRAAVVPGAAPDLRAAALATGVRALGPFSFGLAVPSIGLNATLSHLPVPAGRVALVAQSSALMRAVLDWAGPNDVGFSHIVGIGANATFGFSATLDWLSRDPGTGAILLDVRRIRDRRAFLSAARAAALLRPVVALRPAMDRDADEAFAAAMRRVGVLAVTTLPEFLAAAVTLIRARPARGPALAIVANGNGPALLAAGALRTAGGELAILDEVACRALGALLPEAEPGNPLLLADAPVGRLAEGAAMVSGLSGVGGVLAIHAPRTRDDEADIAALTAAAQAARAPVLTCILGEETAAKHRHRLAEAGLPSFATPEDAVRAFLQLARDRANRRAAAELPPRDVVRVGADRAAARGIIAAARRGGRLSLAEDEALAVVAAYGIPAVPTRAVARAEDAGDAALAVGFPAVVKIRCADLRHKTEAGGVAMNIRTPADAVLAARRIAAEVARRAPGVKGEGFVVQRQAEGGHELQLGMRGDAMFGPVLTFGYGGTVADVVADRAADLPPLNLVLAHALVAKTRTARLLAGWRDRPAVPLASVAEALVRLSQLVVDLPEIAAFDINPLFADSRGVLAADAWVGLHPEGVTGRLAIAPYPSDLVSYYQTKRGERLLIRPIRPEDAAAHAVLFSRLPPEDMRYRFFSMLKDVPPERIARMTAIDYDREMALIAVREATGETLGGARLVRVTPEEAEFALAVLPETKRQGVGAALMRRLIDWARREGVRDIVGEVLTDNRPMLDFVRYLGFAVRTRPEDPEVAKVRLPL